MKTNITIKHNKPTKFKPTITLHSDAAGIRITASKNGANLNVKTVPQFFNAMANMARV